MSRAGARLCSTRLAGRSTNSARAWPRCRSRIGPGQVIVAILTDGLENSSQDYTWQQIADAIKQQSEQYRWTFLFLGANQDAIATAAQMNITAANAAAYVADAAGLHASSSSLARKVRALRRVSMGTASAEECHDAVAPMSGLVAEEDQKERN